MNVGRIRALPEQASPQKVLLKPVSWMAKIELIAHLTVENNVMLSLLGDEGSGKSTFIQVLETALPPHIKPVVFVASHLPERDAFLQELRGVLGIDGEASWSDFIAESKAQQVHTLLIIDNAQHLPIVFIRDILDAIKQQGHSSYFHVCLVSDFSLVPDLNKLVEDTYHDMIHSIEVGVLSEAETKTYVQQNTKSLPGAENTITDERLKQFYELTEGRIEKINRQMVDFFSYKPARSWRHMNIQFIRYAGIAAGVFFAVAGLVYMGLSQDTQPPPAQLVSLELQQPIVDEPSEVEMTSQVPAYHVAATKQTVEITSLRRMDLAAASEDDDEAVSDPVAVVDKVVVAPKIIAPPVAAIKKVAKIPAVKVVPSVAVVKPATAARGLYTIQLLAGRDVQKLRSFAAAHHLNGKAQVRLAQRQGGVWYVLTLGEYAQHAQAKQAAYHLPKDIAQFNPWVRLIADLKAAG